MNCVFRKGGQLIQSNKNWYVFKNTRSFRSFMSIIKYLKLFQFQFFDYFPSKLKLFKRLKFFKLLCRIYKSKDRRRLPKVNILRLIGKKMNSISYLKEREFYRNYDPMVMFTTRRLRVFNSISSLKNLRLYRISGFRKRFKTLISLVLRNKYKFRRYVISRKKNKKKQKEKAKKRTILNRQFGINTY